MSLKGAVYEGSSQPKKKVLVRLGCQDFSPIKAPLFLDNCRLGSGDSVSYA